MADVLDGWGGFTVSYLEQLREDFPKATVVTYGLSDDKMVKNSTMVKQCLAWQAQKRRRYDTKELTNAFSCSL